MSVPERPRQDGNSKGSAQLSIERLRVRAKVWVLWVDELGGAINVQVGVEESEEQ